MFTRIDLLPQYDAKESSKYQERWDNSAGQCLRDKILKMIKNGAGEHFLQWDSEQGKLEFLEDACDLRGINFWKEDITFPISDNFKGIDFSYAQFYHSKFRNATFLSTTFNFTRLYNFEFVNCVFSFTSFYGATLEKVRFINCDFIEHNSMTNCNFSESKCENCFFPTRLFFDCRFDETTAVDTPIDKPSSTVKTRLNKTDLAEIYSGIKESYAAGAIFEKSRQYFLKQKRCITRHNAKNLWEKIGGYFLELIAGYGTKPIRVLITMLVVFVPYSLFFIHKLGISKGLMLSAGAFFTFGANTNYLQTLYFCFKVLYIAEAFSGISLIALFITVLAKNWFEEK